MALKYCRKFQSPEQGARTRYRQTTQRQTDRRTDGRRHIANVNVSSLSLKIGDWSGPPPMVAPSHGTTGKVVNPALNSYS